MQELLKGNELIEKLDSLLQHKKLPISIKRNVIESIFILTLLLPGFNIDTSLQPQTKSGHLEMRWLRKVMVVIRKDRVRNESMAEIVGA